MALTILGKTVCPICGKILISDDDIFSTSGSDVVKADDPLWMYQDAAMHRNCFLMWPLRENFIRHFNEYFRLHYRGMRVMSENGEIEECEPMRGHGV